MNLLKFLLFSLVFTLNCAAETVDIDVLESEIIGLAEKNLVFIKKIKKECEIVQEQIRVYHQLAGVAEPIDMNDLVFAHKIEIAVNYYKDALGGEIYFYNFVILFVEKKINADGYQKWAVSLKEEMAIKKSILDEVIKIGGTFKEKNELLMRAAK